MLIIIVSVICDVWKSTSNIDKDVKLDVKFNSNRYQEFSIFFFPAAKRIMSHVS